jgi:hypothetical protein
MNTNTDTPVDTHASRLAAVGGAGLPDGALREFDAHERRRGALWEDTRLSGEYRAQQLADLNTATEASLRAARDRDVADATTPLEAERNQILAAIKGTATNTPLSDTPAERLERHMRHTREAVAANSELLGARASADPSGLQDLLDEAIESGQTERVRTLGATIIGRLAELVTAQTGGASEAFFYASTRYQQWKRAHPSRIAQLRAVDLKLANVAPSIDQRYERARSHFKFGRHATGIRL